MSLTTCIVTGTYPTGTGTGASEGTFTFQPCTTLTDVTDALIVPAVPQTVSLYWGKFSIALVCTDNANLSPPGWYWIVTPVINGIAQPSWNFFLPSSDAPSVDLSSLIPVEPPPPVSMLYGTTLAGYTNTWLSTNVFDGPVQVNDGQSWDGVSIANPPGGTSLYLRADGSWGLPPGTGGTPASTVQPATSYGVSPAVGTATNYAREDHQHGSVSLGSSAPSTTEGIGQAAALGASATPARSDHVHPLAAAGTPGSSSVGDAALTGSQTTFSASDHQHARESFGSVTAQTTYGAASANGSASTVARSNHAHGTPALDSNAADIQPLAAAAAAGSVGLAADAGHTHPTTGLLLGYVFDQPSWRGYSEANGQSSASPTANTITSNTIFGVTIMCQTSNTVSKFAYHLSTAAGTPVAGENLMALYTVGTTTWTQQAISGDLGTWGTTNQLNIAAFTGAVTSYKLTAGTWVSVLFVCNATTACALRGFNNAAPGYLNDGCSNAAPYWYRVFSIGTGTSLPSTFNASSMNGTTAVAPLIYLG